MTTTKTLPSEPTGTKPTDFFEQCAFRKVPKLEAEIKVLKRKLIAFEARWKEQQQLTDLWYQKYKKERFR